MESTNVNLYHFFRSSLPGNSMMIKSSPGDFGDDPASPSLTIAGAIRQLLASKAQGNRRPVYLKNLEQILTRFARGRENQSLASFGTSEVEAFVAQFKKPGYRATLLNRLSTLFSFAVRRGFITTNPCDKIERPRLDTPTPKVLSPGESQLLLNLTPDTHKPFMALALFAGIRPGEIQKLDWSQVDLKTKTVRVEEAKTRQRRIVPLHDRAVTILARHAKESGAVSPPNISLRRFNRATRSAFGWATWPKDVLRHTAASYLLALHKDVARVAFMLGNSPKVLMSHYHDPVTEADSAAFWGNPTRQDAI